MDLYIVRHGIAIDREDPKCPPDPERYLTEEGMNKTRQVAKGIAVLGITPDLQSVYPCDANCGNFCWRTRLLKTENPPHRFALARRGIFCALPRISQGQTVFDRIRLRPRPTSR